MKDLIKRYKQTTDSNECDMLRHLINWMDARSETLNQNKTTNQLLKEFLNDCFN